MSGNTDAGCKYSAGCYACHYAAYGAGLYPLDLKYVPILCNSAGIRGFSGVLHAGLNDACLLLVCQMYLLSALSELVSIHVFHSLLLSVFLRKEFPALLQAHLDGGACKSCYISDLIDLVSYDIMQVKNRPELLRQFHK